eukprot:12938230-Prorocentrum_lima.AAC.1
MSKLHGLQADKFAHIGADHGLQVLPVSSHADLRVPMSAKDMGAIPSMSAHSFLDVGKGAMPLEDRANEAGAVGGDL